MIKKIKTWLDDLKPLSGWDIVFFGILTIFCYFSFQHPDILHTGGSSFTLLKGHILDFYEANAKVLYENNYLLSTYIIFAIWNLPLYLLNIVKEPSLDVGFAVFWYKALTTLFFAGAAFILYRIGRTIGLSDKNSKLLTAFWISSPILFFSQFIFGQYDILTAFFVLLGVHHYLKRNMNLFILFFSISMTFKYFPAFVFIPLLLLAEKKPMRIIRSLALFVLPFAVATLPFLHSGQFKTGVLGFHTLPLILNAGFTVGNGINISLFIFIWFFMSAIAYLKETENNADFFQWSLYLCMFGSSLIFALVFWHPQWLLFATPFLAITTFMNKRAKFFILLDLVMFFAFIIYTVHQWGGGVDQALLSLGIFKGLKSGLADPLATVFMKKILFFQKREITFTLISAVFFLNIALKFPGTKFDYWQKNFSLKYIVNSWNAVRARFFAGIMFFIVIAFLTLVIPSGRAVIYDTHKTTDQKNMIAASVIKGAAVGQVFEAGCREIRAVVVKLSNYDSTAASGLIFRLSEYDPAKPGGKVLFEKKVTGEDVRNGECTVKMKKIMVLPEKKYIFSFESPDATVNNCVKIWRVASRVKGNKTFAVINNIPQEFDLDFRLYGYK